jgi:hypothetical protein
MMHGHEKSDSAIVATKPANKAERSAAEFDGAKGGGQGECEPARRAPGSVPGNVCQAQERVRQAVGRLSQRSTLRRPHPRWEPYALIGHVRICSGGA